MIWGIEKKIRNGNELRKKVLDKLNGIERKRNKKEEDWKDIEGLEKRLKQIDFGLQTLKNKIKKIKNSKKNGK